MKIGKVSGLAFSIAGISFGAYFGLIPVLDALYAQQITGHQAGIYFSSIGILIGLSCAAIGIISNRCY